MKILTNFNTSYDLNEVPNIIENDLRYCVLDYSKPADVDFIFPPVVQIEQFTRTSADLRIGKYRVQVPLDWSVVIADKNSGSLEILDLKHINDRDFQVFCFNPISGYMPSFPNMEIENIFPDVSWITPQLMPGHLLCVPLHDGPEPLCAIFVRDTNRIPDVLDITKIFS